MFNLSFSEMVLLGIIILVFIGPKELPEIARVIGRFLNDLKRTTGEISHTVLNSTQTPPAQTPSSPTLPHESSSYPLPEEKKEVPSTDTSPTSPPPTSES